MCTTTATSAATGSTLGCYPHSDVTRAGLGVGLASALFLAVAGVHLAVAVVVVPACIVVTHDAARHRLPDRWVAVTAIAAVVAVAVSAGSRSLSVGLVAAGAAGGLLLVAHVAEPRAIGFGDVKLAAALAPLLTLAQVELALGIAWWWCLASGAAIVTGVLGRRSTLPFGPSLVLGIVTVVGLSGSGGS